MVSFPDTSDRSQTNGKQATELGLLDAMQQAANSTHITPECPL